MNIFTEKWVDYVKNNPDWRLMHNRFINAQLINAREKIRALGEEKLIKLFNIQNKELINKLFKIQ